MGIYGNAAIRAIEYFLDKKCETLEEAWKKAIKECTQSDTSQRKRCPHGTFLGLCEAGIIKGVPKGVYLSSEGNKNKEYGLRAYEELNKHPELADHPGELWAKIGNDGKSRNGQMDVVIALWMRANKTAPD